MIKLFQFEPKYGLPNVGPFCMKVESFLRLAKVQYALQFLQDPRKAPKGKLPYIDDNGTIVADSSFIVDHITKHHNVQLDNNLSSHQRGIARMVTGTLEERLYFVMLYSRWIETENWEQIKQMWFSHLPPVVRSLLPGMVRKDLRNALQKQGIGRHDRDEIYAIGLRDLQGLVDLIGDQKYVFGNAPTSVDAVVFSFVANVLKVPMPSPLLDYAADQPVLVDYCARMGKQLFPEFSAFQS